MPRRETTKETKPANTLIVDFQPPELGENRFLLYKTPNLEHFDVVA
jgi:hypothetical protein